MSFRKLLRCSCVLGLCAAASIASAVRIEEIRIDQPGPDRDEYFELFGEAGSSLDGMSYVVLGDGPGGCGTVEAVIHLDGLRLAANGYLCVTEINSRFAAGAERSLAFENNDDVTHLLVEGFSAELYDDLDTDNDGSLDREPWTRLLDAVSFQEGTIPDCVSNEHSYALACIPPEGHFVAGHAFRCEGAWVAGTFELGILDTPGEPNVCNSEHAGVPPQPESTNFLK